MLLLKNTITNSWDNLSEIISRIITDGAQLIGVSDGFFSFLLFGFLLPVACLTFLISASLLLTRNKTGRIVAIVLLCLGCLALLAFLGLSAYAVIFGTHWAIFS